MSSGQGIYIRALQFGADRETFTLQELVKELDLTEDQEHRLSIQISNKEIFFHNRSNYFHEYRKGGLIDLSLSVEDEFRLLEYTELREARASSRQATYFATLALVVSIIATISSIWFSYNSSVSEINYPAEIRKKVESMESNLRVVVEELKRAEPSNKAIKSVPAQEASTGRP